MLLRSLTKLFRKSRRDSQRITQSPTTAAIVSSSRQYPVAVPIRELRTYQKKLNYSNNP